MQEKNRVRLAARASVHDVRAVRAGPITLPERRSGAKSTLISFRNLLWVDAPAETDSSARSDVEHCIHRTFRSRQFEEHRRAFLLYLLHPALLRRFIRTPAEQLRAVAEAAGREVVVANF